MSLINIDWDFQRLEELIQARGDDVIVETGIACPCRNDDHYASTIEREGRPASQRKLACPQCQGDGLIYRNARMVKGLITSINPEKHRKLLETGYALPGDAMFSPSLHAGSVSGFDKITTQFAEPVTEGQVIMRGASSMEENATFVTDLSENEDRLWYMASCASWCEDEDGHVYSQGSDFVLEDRKIRWIGQRPLNGVLYTIKYSGYLEWLCYEAPVERFDRNRGLGQKVVIRKKHVALTTESPKNSPAHRQEMEFDFTTRSKV